MSWNKQTLEKLDGRLAEVNTELGIWNMGGEIAAQFRELQNRVIEEREQLAAVSRSGDKSV